MIFDGLSEAYIRVEEAWYGLVDALSKKGIPLYAYTDFLDKRGIPSLPFTIALVLLVSILLFLSLSSNTIDVNFRFRFADTEGNALNGVKIIIEDSDGRQLAQRTVSSGSLYKLKNMPFNSKVFIEASKEGYDKPSKQEFTLKEKEIPVTFTFHKQRIYITGVLRLHDAATSTLIMNADCNLLTRDNRTVYGRNVDENILFSNIPEGEYLEVLCSANGYEQLDEMLYFMKNEISEASMSPKIHLADIETVPVLIRALDKDSLEPIPNTRVVIINQENDEILFDDIAETGEYLAEIIEGTIVKATLEAEGYITLTTNPFTVVPEIKPIEIKMEAGGQIVTITVVSRTGMRLQGVTLMLFDEDGKLIGSPKKTIPGAFGGIAEFTNLDPNKTYYLTAYKHGFLPARLRFSPGIESDLKIELENAEPSNSARLTLTVLDSQGKPANKARVRFYEIVEGERLPLGIPSMETDAYGKLIAQLPSGHLELEVESDLDRKTIELDVESGRSIEETVSMERKASVVELKFLDNEGKPIKGTVRIRSKSGKVLFEGRPDDAGSVVFDSKGEQTFDVEVETEDGKTFQEEVRIDGQEQAEVTLYTVEEKLKPTIDFVGVFDAKGQRVEGLAKGKFYWLKFVVSWTSVESAGVHVRVGDDSEWLADSMEYGIYGFDAIAKRFFYGKSYQPPLGTREDKLNKGRAGEKNKLLELYFDKPAEQQVIKVKVKVSELSSANNILVHYRAWVKAGEKYFRDPEDSELETNLSTRQRGSFYAETKTASIRIYSTKPKCSEGLCLEYVFIDEEGLEFKPNEFSPVAGRKYALEVRATADSVKDIQLTAETSEQAMIYFSEFKESELDLWPLAGYDKTSISTSTITVSAFEEKTMRAFFETKAEGAAFVKITAQDGENSVEKTLYFKITGLKEFTLDVENQGRIKPGEELKVTVRDKETRKAIEDAAFSFYSGERPVFAVQGDATENNGLNGQYSINAGSLEPGIYRMVVSRRDYQDKETEIIISVEDVLGIEPEKELFLERDRTDAMETIELWNNIMTASIESLDYEFFPRAQWNNNFSIEVLLPGVIEGGRRKNATIRISFIGNPDDRVYAEGELVVSGILGNGLRVEGKTTIKANYNKPIPPECLEITPTRNEVHILAQENASESFNLTVKYIQSEQCTDPLVLSVWAEARGKADPNIEISSPSISIAPGQEKTLAVTVTNKLERFAEPKQKTEFSLIVESDKVSKSVSLIVYFVNPYFSLQTNDNIHIWATVDEDGKLRGIAPLHIRNVGKKAIKNISATESGRYPKSDLFSVMVKPTVTGMFAMPQPEASASLEPGEQIMPPWTIEVIGTGIDYPESIYQLYLDVSGTIDGKRYPSMRIVTLWVHVSTAKCLKLFAVDALEYASTESSQGVISKKVRLRNDCGEIVREITVVPSLLGENQLSLHQTGERNILYPGEEAEFQLKVLKRSDYFNMENPDAIIARGFLVSSQKFIESTALPIILKLGQAPDTEEGPTFDKVEIPVCDAETKQIKLVAFPRIAHEADCENAYCDAVQFSEYLANKLLDVVEEAQDKMRTGNYEASNFNCDPGTNFCSFYSLGIVPEEFTVYLRNDYVSTEVVENSIEEVAPSLGNFRVDFRAGDISDIVETGTGFTPFHIYLSQPLEGCGRYKFSVQGAVQNASGALQKDNIVLLVKVTEDRKVTPECTNKIQNAMNFLPVDGGLDSRRALGTWLGLIQTDQKLHEVGGDFADALFGKREGRVVRQTSSNKLKIILREIERGGIMRLWIGQRSETTATPKTITLELNALFDTAEEIVRNEIATKAKEGLRAMAQGSFALDACISDNEQYMIVQKFERLGELSVDGDKELPLYYDLAACAKLKVSGTIKGEKVLLKTNWNSMSASEKAGLKAVWLETEEGQTINEYDYPNPTPIELEAVEGKEGLYEKKFLLCAEGDNGFVHQAIGQELKVKAKSHSIQEQIKETGKVGVRETEKWHKVEIKVCGMHPYELLEKISELNPEKEETIEAYTVLAWKGEPEELTLDSMVSAWRAFQFRKLPEETGEPTLEQRMRGIRRNSLLIFLGTCVAATEACNFVMFRGFSFVVDPFLYCGMPALFGYFGPRMPKGARNIWDQVKGFFHAEEVDEVVDNVRETVLGESEADETSEEMEEDITGGAIVGISAKEAREIIKKPPTTGKGIRGFFRRLKPKIMGGVIKNLFKNSICGVLSYIVGTTAMQAYLNSALGAEKAREEAESGFSFTGPLSNYEGIETFKKFKPYKITIWRDEYDQVHLKIEELITKEQLEEMDEKIRGDKEKYYWTTDCDNYMNRTIDELIGCLMPDPDVKGVSREQVIAYYSNNTLIAEVCLQDTENPLDEALLMAVLFNEPSKITQCNIDNEWYAKSSGEIESSIKCAASELREAIATSTYLEEAIEKLTNRTIEDPTKLAAYRDNILETYETWQEFNFCGRE